MTGSRSKRAKVEQYARELFDTARNQGRAYSDLTQWRHAVKFSPEVLETLQEMQEGDDDGLIDDVYAELKRLVDADDSIVAVTVTTAVPLDDELRAKVCKKAEELFHAGIYLVERVEPSIIGGVVIEGRGERYDASVRTQLTAIRRNLSTSFMGGDD